MAHKKASIKKASIKSISIVVTLVCIFAAMFCLTACDDGKGGVGVGAEKSISIYIDETKFSVKTDKADVFNVLLVMKNYAAISEFTYSTSTTNGDKFVSTLHNLSPNPASQYIVIYHTINDVTLKGTDWETGKFIEKQKFDKTFYYSGVGVLMLPVKDGASYWFVVESFA